MRLYHLSDNNLDGKTIHPRIPNNYMTSIGAEENTISRSCFANSIRGALIALGQNLEGKILFVHEAVLKDQQVVTNNEIISRGYVPDAKHTGETWIMDPVQLKLIMKIKVTGPDKPLVYTYKQNGNSIRAELWSWKYTKMLLPLSLMSKKR